MFKILNYKRLKEIRISLKLTQNDLSKKIGFSQSIISKVENGKKYCDTGNCSLAMLAYFMLLDENVYFEFRKENEK